MLAAAEPLVDRLWRSETDGADTSTPERRAAILARLDAHAGAIAHADLQRFYRGELRDRFYALFRRPERTPWVKARAAPLPGVLRAERPDMRAAMAVQVLTACLVRPELVDAAFEPLAALRLADPAPRRLARGAARCGDGDPDASAAEAPREAAGARRGSGRRGPRAHRPGVGNLSFARADTPPDAAATNSSNFSIVCWPMRGWGMTLPRRMPISARAWPKPISPPFVATIAAAPN